MNCTSPVSCPWLFLCMKVLLLFSEDYNPKDELKVWFEDYLPSLEIKGASSSSTSLYVLLFLLQSSYFTSSLSLARKSPVVREQWRHFTWKGKQCLHYVCCPCLQSRGEHWQCVWSSICTRGGRLHCLPGHLGSWRRGAPILATLVHCQHCPVRSFHCHLLFGYEVGQFLHWPM